MSAVDELLAGAVSSPVDVDDFKRDRWDRPLIVPADGGQPQPYTRSSTAAKTIDDDYNLNRWQRRNVVYGTAHDQSLVARILAIPGKPDEWDNDRKDLVNAIADDAQKVAQAHKNADIGTAVHKLTERLDAGEPVVAGPYQADLDAYARALNAAGLDTHREWIECRIVCDELEMAGTADRIVTVRPDSPLIELYHLQPGEAVIADLKTGSSVDFGGLGFTAQLAAYANGQLYDAATDTRLPTPNMSKRWGIVIHLPAGRGECTLYAADLVNGLEAARLANKVREARKASRGWLQPIAYGSQTVTDEELHQLLAASIDHTTPAPPAGEDPLLHRLLSEVGQQGGTGPGEVTPPAGGDTPGPVVPAELITETVATLRARFRTAVEAGATRLNWPAGVPLFKDGGPTTWRQVLEVEALVRDVEAETEQPFHATLPADPTAPPAPTDDRFTPTDPPTPTAVEERPTPEQLEPLAERMRALPTDLQADATAAAKAQGLPEERTDWRIQHLPIIETAIAAAEHQAAARVAEVRLALGDFDVDMLTAIRAVAGVTDVPVEQLTRDQVWILAVIGCAIDAGTLAALGTTTGALELIALPDKAEPVLIAGHGSKAAVLAAAKFAAPRWGRPKPKSTAEVVSDPVLVAVLTAEATNPDISNQQGETQ